MRARVPIECGEHEIFSETLPQSLIGKPTADGWTVVEATADGPRRVWLTLEKDVPGEEKE